jgi:hypothetical protein
MEMDSKQSFPFMELRWGSSGKQFSPFMEMVSKQFFHLWNCDHNLRQSAPIGRKLRRNSRPLKQNSVPAATLSEKLTPDAATILSQLARQTQKIKNRLGGLGSHYRNYRKWKQENYYRYDLTDSWEAAIVRN